MEEKDPSNDDNENIRDSLLHQIYLYQQMGPHQHIPSLSEDTSISDLEFLLDRCRVQERKRKQKKLQHDFNMIGLATAALCGFLVGYEKYKCLDSTAKSKPDSDQKPDTNTEIENNCNLSSTKCYICFDKPLNALITPCNHVATCHDCAVSLQKASQPCPICRTANINVIKIFIG